MPIALSPTLRAALPIISLTGLAPTNTLDGRLWARLTLIDDDFTLALFRREAMDSGDQVATATGTGPTLAITQSNASGLAGTCELAADAASKLQQASSEVTSVLQTPPAFAANLEALQPDLDALLDSEGNYAGAPGFSAALNAATRSINDILASRLIKRGWPEAEAREAIALMAHPAELLAAVTHLALARIFEREAGRGDPRADARSAFYRRHARSDIAALRVTLTRESGATTRLTLANPTVRAW